MNGNPNTDTLPAEVSVGTPTDVGDPNDELMMTSDGDTGAAVAATQQVTEVPPATTLSSPQADTAGTNTSSHGTAANS